MRLARVAGESLQVKALLARMVQSFASCSAKSCTLGPLPRPPHEIPLNSRNCLLESYLLPSRLRALTAGRDIEQYAHHSWKIASTSE